MDNCRGLDKRKAFVFVALVAIALLCIVVLVYSLMNAKPHTDPAIQNAPHSSLFRQPESVPASVHS
jgi:type IV secretory pathway VirB3-like protein